MRSPKLIMLSTVSIFMLTLLLGLSPTTAQADDDDKDVVKWKEINGIIPVPPPFDVVGSGTGQVMGAPLPTSATEGEARVDLQSGDVRFEVEGLVIAAGNDIGTAPITAVKGTVVCDTDGSAGGGNSTLVDTDPVPISAQGDAEFDGNVGALPFVCIEEPDIAFLIVVVDPPLNVWIANGAVRIP